ncbi:transposase [Nitrosomonas communis]|uniref:REP-associated tyrosine transposase n=1 Tax=Nitrosomonas communis TaxID=44574 RepID=UPI0026EEF017|nr:transposase [Nitrosomonas communis]MCO6427661.1 transposase [Nitrosomonas communis]
MARPLRIELAGGLYHVTSRGDRREEIYLDDADRTHWLALLGHVCKRFNWICHAYCLMDNHYHILVETVEGNLSRGMRQLNGVYTQYVNRRHNRVGHVFQGRYKAILVEKESYLLELSRYVVLNPVRAGMVTNIDQWPWSSYPAMIGKNSCPEWLQTDWILGQFGKQRKQARAAYVDFVRAGVGLPSVWNALRGQIYLGSDTFVDTMLQHVESDKNSSEIPRAQRKGQAKPLSDYSSFSDRNEGIMAAYQTGDYTMKQIADEFGLHYATISRIVKKAEKR